MDIATKLHVAILASRGELATFRLEIGDPFNEKYHTKDDSSQSGQSILATTMLGIKHRRGLDGWEVWLPAVVLLTETPPVSPDKLDSNDGANSTAQSTETSPQATCLAVGEKADEIIPAMDDGITAAIDDEIIPAVDDEIIPAMDEEITLAMDEEITEGVQIQNESDSNISGNSTANLTRRSTRNYAPQVPAALTANPPKKRLLRPRQSPLQNRTEIKPAGP
ncbi:hypothetical protein V499_06613 [Pseudogymnoascus sp. VKM F-103]|nr:hypothetical protein V499_06613 [Pseudogymnoascus sp. VKM F-103]